VIEWAKFVLSFSVPVLVVFLTGITAGCDILRRLKQLSWKWSTPLHHTETDFWQKCWLVYRYGKPIIV